MLTYIKSANLGLSFVLELCLLAAFAAWGLTIGRNTPVKILLGLSLPLLAAIFWGGFLAPKAKIILSYPIVQVLKFAIFTLAAAALAASHHPNLAWLLGAAFVLNRIIEYL